MTPEVTALSKSNKFMAMQIEYRIWLKRVIWTEYQLENSARSYE